jgi:outer membrane murein-binding lipoprotein Lpp
MERRRYSVLGLLVLGACVVSGCGNKKEDSPTSETASTATLTPEVTVPPPVVPPPTPVVPPTPTPVVAKPPPPPADPVADSKVVVACCVGMRTEAGRLSGTERTRMQNVGRTCSDLAQRVRKGESSKEKALSAVRAAATGMKLPPACSG